MSQRDLAAMGVRLRKLCGRRLFGEHDAESGCHSTPASVRVSLPVSNL
jgi:hypothetical protein